MADGNSGGNNGMLYFIVGALCVVVAAGAFVMFGGLLLFLGASVLALFAARAPAPTAAPKSQEPEGVSEGASLVNG